MVRRRAFPELTYLPSTRRWQKKHKLKTYYFPTLPGESKATSYRRCLREWHRLRGELAAAESEGAAKFAAWQAQVRQAAMEQAQQVALATVRDIMAAAGVSVSASGRVARRGGPAVLVSEAQVARWARGVPALARPIADPESQPVEQPTIDRYLARKQQDHDNGELSAGRLKSIKQQIEKFREWLGDTPIEQVKRADLVDYRDLLLGQYKRSTASTAMVTVRQLFGWIEAEDPDYRAPNFKGLGVNVPAVEIQVVDLATVRAKLATLTNPRYRVWVLLGLNTGMVQQDLSDLLRSQVQGGTITRKRSKARNHADAPTVTYQLWPSTAKLLARESTKQGPRVFARRDGSPLIRPGSDPVGLVIRQKLGFGFRELRKAAGDSIGQQFDLETAELFLGHSPKSMGQRHYVRGVQAKLNKAVAWLGKQLGQC